MEKGLFFTFEGIDGSGKSTHIDTFNTCLMTYFKDTLVTREPGGTPLGEKLHTILLTDQMNSNTELLLMFAARSEHIVDVIKPALDNGVAVISDRFTDSSFAY